MKLLLKLFLGLLALVVLAVGLLLVLVDPNDFKPELESLARDKGQLDLQLKGDIGWSLFPNIALSLPALDVNRLDGKPLASLQRAEINVRILPLLSGNLQMSGILLDGLKLDWTVPPVNAEQQSANDPETKPAGSSAAVLLFDIGQIQISNAQIRYADPAQGRVIELKNFNLSAESLVSGQYFPLAIDFELAMLGESKTAELESKTRLQTELMLDLATQRFNARALQLQLGLAGAAFSKPVDLSISADLEVDQGRDSLEVKGLKLALANLLLNADLKVVGASDQPLVTGALRIPEFDLKQLLVALGQPEMLTRDDAVLRKVGFEATLVGPAGVLGLDALELTLDQTRFNGSLNYTLQSGAQKIKLTGDSIDVDRYLPPVSDNQDASSPSAEVAGERYSKEPILPLETLRTLPLIDADLGLATLKASGMLIEQLKLRLTAEAGLIRIKQVAGKLYQGSFDNSATLDARKAPLRLEIKKQISDIQLGKMLMDLAEMDRFSGQFSMQGGYQAQGNSIYDIVHTLDGSMSIGLKQGRLKGVNLGDTLCRGILQLKGQQPPAESAQGYTAFSNLGATAKITQGVLANHDLKASLVGISLLGDGVVDLPAEALDYGVELTVLQDFASDNCRIDEKLHNLSLPLRCKGGFDTDPAKLCSIDKARIKQVLSKLVGDDAKQKLQGKLEQKLEEKVKGNEALKGALKGLFK